LAEFGRAFNSMALALKERVEQMRDFAQTRIRESERLAVVGQLAAGVAHELSNPLQGIVAYSHLLLEQMPADDERRDYLEKMSVQGNRCVSIIRALLDFSRPRKPEMRPCDINSVFTECLSLVEGQALFHNIEVVRNLEADLPDILVDPAQIQQVLMNLIINAVEAMDGTGRLTLTTRMESDGTMVVLEVADTGEGIAEEDIERVFDPFFSTKDPSHGTGLGLSISYGIVREHGGTISVTSSVGEGTTFAVRLPIVDFRPMPAGAGSG
jgi:two-component system NtrC family sensor kinase